jgi:exosortase
LVLIPFVTLVLIYWDRETVFSSVRSARSIGIAVLAVGLALLTSARLYGAQGNQTDLLSWEVLALVVLGWSGFLLCYGESAFRAALFPLLFAAFMIPIPSVLLDGAVSVLKSGSTEAVAGMFTVTGTPYLREGFIFRLPGFSIEVADECSGIRSSIALLLTSLLAGHVCLRRRWTRLVLVLAVLPIAIFKNGIRITGLTLLAMYVDIGFLTGQLHREGGIAFFLLALVFMAPVLILLRNSESTEAQRPDKPQPTT